MISNGDRTMVAALLNEDPDLAHKLRGPELAAARQRAIAHVIRFDRRTWDPSEICAHADDDCIGLFVLDGLLVRRVTVGKRQACELFGPGDIFRPWDADGEYEPLTISLDWLVLVAGRLAVLDGRFALRIARWPSITAQLMSRVARRARHLALTQAVTHLPRVYGRLLILFWLLAERWGTVTPEGFRVSLPLTHELLALLVGAHRPTVTLALQRLSDAGLLVRKRRNDWLLTHAAVERISDPESRDLVLDDPERVPPVRDAVAGAQTEADRSVLV
jgi:CRP/FNR family transcriptional regulator, cyclic AMP receptor protein